MSVKMLVPSGFKLNSFFKSIYSVNCGNPRSPTNGSLGNYSRTTKGAEVMFMCDLGFVPTSEVRAICNDTGSWDPAPERHHCTAESMY